MDVRVLVCTFALLLSGCGGNDATPAFNIGGIVSGLSGSGLTIADNGSETMVISANGSFTFVNRMASGAAYAVSVTAQPCREHFPLPAVGRCLQVRA